MTALTQWQRHILAEHFHPDEVALIEEFLATLPPEPGPLGPAYQASLDTDRHPRDEDGRWTNPKEER